MKPLKLKKISFRPAVDDKGFDIFSPENNLIHIYPDGELSLLKWLAQKQEVALMAPDSKIMGGPNYQDEDDLVKKNPNYTRSILDEFELQFLVNETIKISKNPTASGEDLRQAASMHAVLAAHHSGCIVNLLDNADEADMNKRMGEERRSEKPPHTGEETDEP